MDKSTETQEILHLEYLRNNEYTIGITMYKKSTHGGGVYELVYKRRD